MERHRDPYYDDEEDTIESSPSKSIRMEPMSVSTGADYGYGINATPMDSNRKAMLASLLSVTFLAIGWFLTDEYRASVMAPLTPADYPKSPNSPKKPATNNKRPFCQDFNDTYFTDLIQRIQDSSQEDLCSKDKKMHSCRCNNPLVPVPQESYPGWQDAVDMNIALMKQNYSAVQPEVVLYGDSITEHLLGRNFGKFTARYDGIAHVTQSLLSKRGGGKINGLPMGVSGDHMAYLLWRLQNGEMPDSLKPKVWWILIGTNDLGMGCSIDTIVAGNVRIVQEIRERHDYHQPHNSLAPIVINSILPRSRKEMLHAAGSPWPSLHQINQQLECYADNTPGVYFVNATDIFIQENSQGIFIDEDSFEDDHLHPNAKGTRVWLDLIVDNVMQLMT